MSICSPQRGVPQALLLTGVLLAGAVASFGQEKLPVPDEGAQTEAVKLIRELYEQDYKGAKTPAEQTALANKLLEQAAASKDDPTAHFVLLRVARDMAVQAGDAKTALEAVDRIARRYQIDDAAMRAETLLSAAANARLADSRKAVVEAAIPLIRAAIGEDDYETANRLVRKAFELARRSRDSELLKQMVAVNKEVADSRKAHAEVQQARATLEEKPTDPEANLAVGRYLCVSKGDWEKGIPMLALGSDPALKALAVRELGEVDSPNVQVALADAWWDLAQKKTGPEKDSFLLRAGYWYHEAEPSLASALAKAKVRKRLEEIAKLGRPIQEASSGPPLAIAPFDAKQARILQLRWSKHLRTPVVKMNSIGMKLVLIPPGEFEMGSTEEETDKLLKEAKQRGIPQQFIDLYRSEAPQHRVKMTQPFYLGMYEVTQVEYQQVMGVNPSRIKTSDPGLPVEKVSWNDAREFCRRLSELPEEKAAGRVYQLPTEAQWEYACRAGTTTRCYYGNDLARLGEYAWFPANSQSKAHRVGQKTPNAWGLCDMLGNVLEWCADWYGDDYYEHSPQDDPSGPSAGTYRVLRGGSWLRLPDYFWCAYRNRRAPDYVRDCAGFRVIRTLNP